ncbi:unnamed protein product [Cercopithifilaria johnstoni]|uniref:Protein kinase domain-containing protein n=1 Tax=Cercopithifilaria johnstoni TaxID=2874296 RepID=A0A8J2LLN3_9BILA|nr:unnamed protein product [Cercopithifilaria johnstoni]
MSKQSKLKSNPEIVKKVVRTHDKKTTKESKLNRENRIRGQMERKLATYQLSCTKFGNETRNKYEVSQKLLMKSLYTAEEIDKRHALAEHLRSIAPFNHRWQVTETINEGTYGVVFAVRDVETGTKGVIKVAKIVGNDAGNQAAEWEGMLVDQNGAGMEFMVLEKAEVGIVEWLSNFSGIKRKLAVTKAMLQMLKGIYDMHREGLLHRDLKPDNMGILNIDQPFVVLFDLGMTKMYTDEEGKCRTPRSTCAFRGTPEWASGWASKGREQNRFDDLISWLYVACELYDPSLMVTQPLPWTNHQNKRIINYLKTVYCPAQILLRRAPRQFYEINAYLMTANRNVTPKYKFLADKVMEAIKELKILADGEKTSEKNSIENKRSTDTMTEKTSATTESIQNVKIKRMIKQKKVKK